MNEFCPNCERLTHQTRIERDEMIMVRGESLPVHVELFHCDICGQEYEKPRPDYDPLAAAYREYRRRKGLLQPEEIKAQRKKLDLTQKEFSQLLGIGIATLNRYENGTLQSEAHNRLIRACAQPENLRQRLAELDDSFSAEVKARLLLFCEKSQTPSERLLVNAIEILGAYPANEYSGFIQFNADKFFRAAQYFCAPAGMYKTKLMKLLFYADFLHCKHNGVSITGAHYAHLPYGPVPDQFETWLAAMTEWEPVLSLEEQSQEEFLGEVYHSLPPDLSIFSNAELATLEQVKTKFQAVSTRTISHHSHQEPAYTATRTGELISYKYAQDLRA